MSDINDRELQVLLKGYGTLIEKIIIERLAKLNQIHQIYLF